MAAGMAACAADGMAACAAAGMADCAAAGMADGKVAVTETCVAGMSSPRRKIWTALYG